MTGSITAEDPEGLELLRLRAEVAEFHAALSSAARATTTGRNWRNLLAIMVATQNSAIGLAQRVATLTAERDSLRTRIENAEAGSVIAKAAIDGLTAERDAARVAIEEAKPWVAEGMRECDRICWRSDKSTSLSDLAEDYEDAKDALKALRRAAELLDESAIRSRGKP